MIRKTFSENLIAMRTERGWKQKNAAEACQISLRYYQDIEGGASWPSSEMITTLAKGFDVEVSRFFLSSDMQDKEVIRAAETIISKLNNIRPTRDRLAHVPLDILEDLEVFPEGYWQVLRLAIAQSKRSATAASKKKKGQ